MITPTVTLRNKQDIPQIGLGLWKVKDKNEFNTAFSAAIKAGYTHFDTAQAYDNEQFLGEAWHAAELKREAIWITTKIAVQNFGKRRLNKSFEDSLQRLQTDYVDLLLLHFPVSIMRKHAWQDLEAIHAEGKARSIGVSNFTVRHLEEMQRYANVAPAVNQVELHVFLQQPELIAYCKDNDIAIEAYSPIAHAQAMDNSVIAGIAKKHKKSYAQIMLRWLLEQDLIVLPKSVTPSRIQENISVFDFTLDDKDMESLAKLDQDMRTCWNPTHVP